MISNTIQSKIATALKAHDEVRLSTYRMLYSALNYERIDKMRDLTEEEEIVVVKKEAKKRKDAIEAYEKANATDRAAKEKEELKVLEEFLPKMMSEEEVEKLVDSVISEFGKDQSMKGRIIGESLKRGGGLAEGKLVSELVMKKL